MRAPALAVAALVAGFAVGLTVSGLRGKPPAPDGRAPEASLVGDTRGARHVDASATENQRTEPGARAAAVVFATASQDWLYLSDEEIDRSVRVIATPAAGPSLSRETVAELGAARDALRSSPGRVWWLVRPLASRVERFDPTSARVVVWTLTVLSAADVALPQAEWMRVAVDLVWADGAWLVQAVADTPGPTPMSGTSDRPWEPEALDRALDGFERQSNGVAR